MSDAARARAADVESEGRISRRRGTGGIVAVREGVWRIDVEVSRDPETNRRRRRSRTVRGTFEDAERLLDELTPVLVEDSAILGTAHPRRDDNIVEDGFQTADRSAAEIIAEVLRQADAARPRGRRKAEARHRRQHGTGGVIPVRDGVWKLSLEVPPDPVTGRRRRATRVVYGEREDAELALANFRVTAARQRQPARRANHRSMRALFDLYLAEAKAGRIELAPKTIVTSRSGARTMCKQELPDGQRFGELRPERCTWESIEDLYGAMKRNGLGVDWIRRCATVLNRTLEYAKKRGVIDANPCAEATRPRTVRTKPYSPTHEEVDALMDAVRAYEVEGKRDEELIDALEIMKGTGMRKGEFLALFVENLDLKNDDIHLAFAVEDGGPDVGVVRMPTKKSDWRDVPMDDPVKEAIERQLARRRVVTGQAPRGGEYLFPGDLDGLVPIRPDDLSDRLAVARGKSAVTFLDLRHYFATTLLDAGVPYRTVADLMGNSEVTLRLHYDGRTDTGKRDAIKALHRKAS